VISTLPRQELTMISAADLDAFYGLG